MLFLTFSALVANPKKTTLHGGQSRSWSAEQGKKEKEQVWQPPPPPRALLVRRSRGASTCLGATQVGVTQVVSVRLASVQGFRQLGQWVSLRKTLRFHVRLQLSQSRCLSLLLAMCKVANPARGQLNRENYLFPALVSSDRSDWRFLKIHQGYVDRFILFCRTCPL